MVIDIHSFVVVLGLVSVLYVWLCGIINIPQNNLWFWFMFRVVGNICAGIGILIPVLVYFFHVKMV